MQAKSLTAEALLKAVSKIIQVENSDELLTKILESAKHIFHADAAAILIPDDHEELQSVPVQISFSKNALEQVKAKRKTIIFNESKSAEPDSTNRFTSSLVSPFRIQQSDNCFLYLHRFKNFFEGIDCATFETFVHLCEKIVFATNERLQNKQALSTLQKWQKRDNIVYASQEMQKVMELADKFASFPFPIILCGEKGTGKEAFARHIHKAGPRSERPFVAINCSVIPETWIEKVLFGTSASDSNAIEKGVFETAEGGTVFLKEIAALKLDMQQRLLRALNEKRITRIGETKDIPINVRVIASTSSNLENQVKLGAFREDLFTKLNAMTLNIPSLKERGLDVIFLANEFLNRYGLEFGREKLSLSKTAEKALLSYHWPGNITELEKRIQKTLVTATRSIVSSEDLGLAGYEKDSRDTPRTLKEAHDAVDRECIDIALKKANANMTVAASMLGIDRKVLRDIMKRLGMNKGDYKH